MPRKYKYLLEAKDYYQDKKDEEEASKIGHIMAGGSAIALAVNFFMHNKANILGLRGSRLSLFGTSGDQILTYNRVANAICENVTENLQSFGSFLCNNVFGGGANNIFVRIIGFLSKTIVRPITSFVSTCFGSDLYNAPASIVATTRTCVIAGLCAVIWWFGKKLINGWIKKHNSEDDLESSKKPFDGDFREDRLITNKRDLALFREEVSRKILSTSLLKEGFLDIINPFYWLAKLASSLIDSVTTVLSSITKFIKRHPIFSCCIIFLGVMIGLGHGGNLFKGTMKAIEEASGGKQYHYDWRHPIDSFNTSIDFMKDKVDDFIDKVNIFQ